MCESMCVGSLKMTYVPEPAVQPKPRERIKARKLHEFQLGDIVFNTNANGINLHNSIPYMVVGVGYEKKLLVHEGTYANKVIDSYNSDFVLESETIIENGVRVVGYVNDPCPAPQPKIMKFNDLPDWTVFSVVYYCDKLEFIKTSETTVVYWRSNYSQIPNGFGKHTRVNTIDSSFGIFDNSADCTVIGSIRFG